MKRDVPWVRAASLANMTLLDVIFPFDTKLCNWILTFWRILKYENVIIKYCMQITSNGVFGFCFWAQGIGAGDVVWSMLRTANSCVVGLDMSRPVVNIYVFREIMVENEWKIPRLLFFLRSWNNPSAETGTILMSFSVISSPLLAIVMFV